MSVAKKADCQGMDINNAPEFKEAKPLQGDHRTLLAAVKKRSHARFGKAYKELVNR